MGVCVRRSKFSRSDGVVKCGCCSGKKDGVHNVAVVGSSDHHVTFR